MTAARGLAAAILMGACAACGADRLVEVDALAGDAAAPDRVAAADGQGSPADAAGDGSQAADGSSADVDGEPIEADASREDLGSRPTDLELAQDGSEANDDDTPPEAGEPSADDGPSPDQGQAEPDAGDAAATDGDTTPGPDDIALQDGDLDSAGDTPIATDQAPAEDGDSGGAEADATTLPPPDPNVCPYGLKPSEICLKLGACQSGVKIVCIGNSPVCDYGGAPGWQLIETACDGVDNDCNGLVDDDLPAPAWASGKGVCAKVAAQCQGKAGWGEPAWAALPGYQTAETACDGLDNDCDGLTDVLAAAPPLSPQPGVCGVALMVCQGAKGWQNPPKANIAGWEPIELSCDGKDNDCDGAVDEALYKPNAAGSGLGKADLGVCAGAPLVCQAGAWQAPDYADWTAPPGGGTPTFQEVESACDGLDNDCDGQVDVFSAPPPPAAKVEGVCVGLAKICAGASGWVEPAYAQVAGYSTAPEAVCDGADNDCDGLTDEDAACPLWLRGGGGAGAIALSPDGVQLLWLSHTGVHAIHPHTGAHQYDHLGHRGSVGDAAFSPDGKWVASVGALDVLRIYPAAKAAGPPASWPVTAALTSPGEAFTAVAWAPDGQSIAVGSSAGALQRYTTSGAPGPSTTPHQGAVRAIAFTTLPTGVTLCASGGDDGKVMIQPWPGSGAQVLATPVAPVVALDAELGGARLAVAVAGLAARVYHLGTGKQVAWLTGSPTAVAVRFGALPHQLWSVDALGVVKRWQVPAVAAAQPALIEPTATWAPPDLEAGAEAVDLAVGPTFVHVGTTRGAFTLHPPSGLWTALGDRHRGAITSVRARPDLVATAGADGTLGLWSAAHGQPALRFVAHDGAVTALALGPSAGLLFSAGGDFAVRAWQPGADPTAVPPPNLATFGLGGPWAVDLAWSGGGAALWAAAGSAAVRFAAKPPAIGQKLALWSAGIGVEVAAVAPSPDGASLLVGLLGGTAQWALYDANTLALSWQRADLPAGFRAAAWRGDGKAIALSGGKERLVVVAAATGATLHALEGHDGDVRAVAWADDRLLSASSDGTARVWATAGAAKTLAQWSRHCPPPCQGGAAVSAAAWVDGAKRIAATGSDDGAVHVWRAP